MTSRLVPSTQEESIQVQVQVQVQIATRKYK